MWTPGRWAIRRSSWLPAWARGSPAKPFTWIAATTSWDSDVFMSQALGIFISRALGEGALSSSFAFTRPDQDVTRENSYRLRWDRSADRGRRGVVRLSPPAGPSIFPSRDGPVRAEWTLAGGDDGEKDPAEKIDQGMGKAYRGFARMTRIKTDSPRRRGGPDDTGGQRRRAGST